MAVAIFVPELTTFCVVAAARADTVVDVPADGAVDPRATVVRPDVAARADVAAGAATGARTAVALRAVAARADVAVLDVPAVVDDAVGAAVVGVAVVPPPRRCCGTAAWDMDANTAINSEKTANLFIISLCVVK